MYKNYLSEREALESLVNEYKPTLKAIYDIRNVSNLKSNIKLTYKAENLLLKDFKRACRGIFLKRLKEALKVKFEALKKKKVEKCKKYIAKVEEIEET